MRTVEILSPLEHAGYLAHARSPRFRNRLEKTLDFLREIFTNYSAHVSLSGGKDSTLSWFLATRIKPGIPAAHFDSGGEHPLSAAFVEEVAESFGAPLRVYYPRLSYIDLLQIGYGAQQYVSSEKLRRFIIHEPAERAAKDFGSNAYVIGLRREESPGRDASGLFHGPLYTPKDGGVVRIAPLLQWTVKDVWAATVLFDLPVHPAYAERMPSESIENMRVGVLTDLARSHTAATLSRFKSFHPEHYARLKASVPEAPWPH